MTILTSQDICAIVTTYRSTEVAIRNVANIASQVNFTIVIDDSGDTANNNFLAAALNSEDSILLMYNASNDGLASSLNRGIEQASIRGYRWVITFDDDTGVTQGAIARLVAAINTDSSLTSAQKHIYALARPSHCSPHLDKTRLMQKDVVITSGSMCHTELFKQTGGFDDGFFIDLLDFDFCLKCRNLGGKIYMLNSPELNHSLGTPELVKLLGLKLFLSNHSPSRYYYHFRNAIGFSGRHIGKHPLFVLKLVTHLLFSGFKILLFEKNRMHKLKHIVLGLYAGFRGKYGKIPLL